MGPRFSCRTRVWPRPRKPESSHRPLRPPPPPGDWPGGDPWAAIAAGPADGISSVSFGQLKQAADKIPELVGNTKPEARVLGGRHAIRAAVVTIAALALTACGAGASSPAPATAHSAAQTPTSVPPTSPSSPADVARQQAIAAYLGMWRDFADAATTSDWRSPNLAQNATGDALSTLSRGLYADHYNGLVSRGRPVNNPQVSTADPAESPTKVVISDCGDSTNWLKYRADNGQAANDGPGGRRQINAIVKKAVDGSWKVTDFGAQAVGTC